MGFTCQTYLHELLYVCYLCVYVLKNVEPIEPFRVSLDNHHPRQVWGIVHFNLMPIFGALHHEAKCIVDHFHLASEYGSKLGVYCIPIPKDSFQLGKVGKNDGHLQGCQICKCNCSGNLGLRNELIDLWLVKKLCCFCTAPELWLHMDMISAKNNEHLNRNPSTKKHTPPFFWLSFALLFLYTSHHTEITQV